MLSLTVLVSLLPLVSALQTNTTRNEESKDENVTSTAVAVTSDSHLRAKRQFGGFGGFGGGCCAPIIPPICCGMGIPIPPPMLMGGFGGFGGGFGGFGGGIGGCCSCCQPVCMPMCMGRGCGCGGFGGVGFGRKKREAVLRRNPPALRLTYV